MRPKYVHFTISRVWVILISFCLILCSARSCAANLSQINISIEELGPTELATAWQVKVEPFNSLFSPPRIVLPGGEVLERKSPSWNGRQWKLDFDSIENAVASLHGEWIATQTSRIGRGSPGNTLRFTIDEIPIDNFRRSLPQLESPQPGDIVIDDQPFQFAWSYPADKPDPTILLVHQSFVSKDGVMHYSELTFDTDNPQTTQSTHGLNGLFYHQTYEYEPGEELTRNITLDFPEIDLPLQYEMSIGGMTRLNDFITDIFESPESSSSFEPVIKLNYVRLADTFAISVVTPEPSSILLATLAVLLSLGRARMTKRG